MVVAPRPLPALVLYFLFHPADFERYEKYACPDKQGGERRDVRRDGGFHDLSRSAIRDE